MKAKELIVKLQELGEDKEVLIDGVTLDMEYSDVFIKEIEGKKYINIKVI